MPDGLPDNDVDALRRRVAELESLLHEERARNATRGGDGELQYLLEAFPYAVLVVRQGKILFANKEAARLHGAESPGDLRGIASIDLVHPDDRPLIFSRRRERSLDLSVPHRRVRLDGSEFIARLRPAEIRWGGERAVVLVIRDTTARANDRLALEESERRYRDLIEGSTFGIQISRKNGERLFVNQKFVEMFRYDSADDMMRVSEPGALVAPHDRAWMVERRLARERGEPVPEVYEYDALRKDGTFMPVQVFFREVYWEGEEAIQRTMIDITSRRETEMALRESEERYRHLAELSPDGILINTGGIIVFANLSLATIVGEDSPEALIGMDALDLLPPQYRKDSIARRELALTGAPVERMEGIFMRKDGSETHVERSVKLITWQGKPSTLVLVRDINKRKAAEAELQEQKVLLETVINAMDPTLCAWDKDLKLVVWNQKWAEERKFPEGLPVRGMTYEEVMRWGFRTGRYVAKDAESMITRRLDGLRKEIEPETVLEQPDGRILLRKRHALPDGGYVSTHIDITELKRAQDASRESEERYRSLVEVVPQAVLVIDDGNILFCNPAANRLFGATRPGELIGKSHSALIHPESRPLVRNRIGREFATRPATRPQELRCFRLDGTEIVTETFSAPYQWNGRAVRLVLIRDVTERKKTEAERERMLKRIEEQSEELKKMAENSDRARREAQAANQAKSEFLALMSHELRTPLNAVLGFSEIISTEAFGPLGTTKYGEYAKDIYESGQHLLDLINDILDLSKVESGKDEIHEEDIGVPEFVSQLVPLVVGRAERGAVRLDCTCAPDVPRLRADRRKLKQIMVNLLSNAIKFTGEGGQVKLRVECPSGEGHVFRVIDTGIGIAPEDIPKAMSPFRQVESELNRKIEGTGLGLPLSKALVELHGGTLKLESELGVGTRVTIQFPCTRVVRTQGAPAVGKRLSA